MWLRLTQMPSEELIVINSELVEAYGPSNENNANAYLNMNNDSYQVKESVENIDNLLRETDNKGSWR